MSASREKKKRRIERRIDGTYDFWYDVWKSLEPPKWRFFARLKRKKHKPKGRG